MKYIFILCLVCLSTTTLANSDSTIYTLVQNGLPNPAFNSARNIVQIKWNIRYIHSGGCVISETQYAKQQHHNDSVMTLLNQKYGDNWYATFLNEINEEMDRHKAVRTLIYDIDDVYSKAKQLAKAGNLFAFYFEPITPNEYTVILKAYGDWHGQQKYLQYYKFQVFLNQSKVILIDDTIQL